MLTFDLAAVVSVARPPTTSAGNTTFITAYVFIFPFCLFSGIVYKSKHFCSIDKDIDSVPVKVRQLLNTNKMYQFVLLVSQTELLHIFEKRIIVILDKELIVPVLICKD